MKQEGLSLSKFSIYNRIAAIFPYRKDTNPKPFSIDDRSALINGQTGSDWEMDTNVGRKGRQGGSCNLSGKGKLFHAHGKT